MPNASTRFSNDLRYRNADHPSNTALTPAYILDPIRSLVGRIGLDPCTTSDNPVNARVFYTIKDNGLLKKWTSSPIFVNPPYAKAREPWVHRCIEAAEQGIVVLLLIPAATDTAIFQSAVRAAKTTLFIKGRLKFGVLRPNRRQVAASHPSALIGFNVDLSPLRDLGIVVRR